MLKVLLADNHVLSSAGLKYILSKETDLEIKEVIDYTDLLKIMESNNHDLLLIDYQNFKDFDLKYLYELKQNCPELHIMIISSDQNKDRMSSVLNTGISGFLTKECSKEEVLLAIKSIRKGEKFFCNRVYDLLMDNLAPKKVKVNPAALTNRETEILKLIVEGNSTQNIADHLFLSYHTVNSHRKSICKKLKIKSPTELVIYAMDIGLLKVGN
ncbi:MAG TPA: response regulator transcription factor [Cytophagales bacterium]|nr:response regulator transcription factor [Cytophagales bacterium]